MKRVLAVKERGTSQSIGSLKSTYRHGFSRGLILGLILLSAFIMLSGSLLYGQEGADALFIDEQGNVGIGTNDPNAKLDVRGATNLSDTLTVDGVTTLGKTLIIKGDTKISGDLTSEGDTKMSGDLTIDSSGAITIPAGTTKQRQTSPQNGALRYNTTAKMVEVFFEGMWFVIETTPYPGVNVKVFEYEGADHTFTVSEGINKIFVKAWGAGGAGGTKGGWVYGSYGGGGGFSRGVLTVIPDEILTIVVGRGGQVHQTDVGYGGGGAVTKDNHDNRYCGGGGGRSAVVGQGGAQRIIAGGGGGGGSTRSSLFWGKGNSGGAGGGLIGENGYSQYDEKHSLGGRGGGQDLAGAGGTGGAYGGGPGEGFNGGTIKKYSYGGGGGGGWKGGGSGDYSEPNTMGGGGGGSGYINNASYAITMTGTQRQCPMQNDPDYLSGVGIGGQDAQDGGHGLVVIRW